MTRTSHQLSPEHKNRISQGLRDHHAHRTAQQKRETAEKTRQSLLRYWASLPMTDEDDENINV